MLLDQSVISRANSFPLTAIFRVARGIWFFSGGLITAEYYRGIRLSAESAEFDVFHSNNYFFTENDLKVALLQVCL